MGLPEKKQFLLHIIEDADERLTGLLLAVANEYNESPSQYSQEDLNVFNDRRESFYANGKKGFTPEEVEDMVRRQHKDGL
jgi:hypothetical protein